MPYAGVLIVTTHVGVTTFVVAMRFCITTTFVVAMRFCLTKMFSLCTVLVYENK